MSFFKPGILYGLFLFLGVFLLPASVRAEVTASVNTISVNEGSSLTLTIKNTEASLTTNPDLNVLNKDFFVSGTQKGVRNIFVNGSFSSVTEWNILLTPKNIGNIVIPPITVGKEKTRSISIQVKPATSRVNLSSPSPDKNDAGDSSSDVFLKVAIDVTEPYVQSQILYIVRLYSIETIDEGVLLPPQIPDALVEKIGEDIRFESTVSGRFYHVLERRFAIFPQKSGALTIPPSEFEGKIIDKSVVNPAELFLRQSGLVGGGIAATFATTKNILVRSDTLAVNVLPKPKDFSGKWWLPAYDLKISQIWEPANPEFAENKTVTRTIIISAEGLSAYQLPDIKIPEDKYLKVYPAKSEKLNQTGSQGILGVNKISMVLIPTAAGAFTLPEIKIAWWNIKKKRMETAVLPAESFQVKGSTPRVQEPENPSAEDTPEIKTLKEEIPPPAPEKKTGGEKADKYIAYILIFIGILGLSAVVLFLLYRRKSIASSGKEVAHDKEAEGRFADIEKALDSEDIRKLRDALLAWAKKYWQDNPPFNIIEIGKRLKNAKLQKELEELESSLYANRKRSYGGDELVKTLKAALNTRKAEAKKVKPVPDLYPQTK